MKDDIKILLERRKELKEEINKLQEEYTAIGNVLTKVMEVTEQEQKEETILRLEKQIKEQTRNGRTDIYIDNKDLGFITGMEMSEGKSVVDVTQLQDMIDNYDER